MRSQMQPHPDQLANNNHVPDFRNRDFVICSLDLIAGLADGVGAPIAELIAKSGLTDVLIRCCQVCLTAQAPRTSIYMFVEAIVRGTKEKASLPSRLPTSQPAAQGLYPSNKKMDLQI